MRHLKAGRALGVKPAHRRAMMRNLVTSVLEHGQVRTTMARAKELRKPLDKMITLGKRGDLAARRQALSFIQNKPAMANLFGDVAERFADRQGGYTRIIATGPRRGDGAQMALVVLVGDENDPFKDQQRPSRQRQDRSRRVQQQVSRQVQQESQQAQPAAATAAATEAAESAPAEAAPATEAEATPAPEASAAPEETAEEEAAPAEEAAKPEAEAATEDEEKPEKGQ